MTFRDIRVRRLLSDLRNPSRKAGMNQRSLAYLRLALRSKRRCVLFASFPRCGVNWVDDVLTCAITKHFTGAYRVEYADNGTLKQREIKPHVLMHPADSRSARRPLVSSLFSELNIDHCFHTHGAWKESPLWGLDEAKTIFIVRNIPASLYSYLKTKSEKYSTMQEFVADGFLEKAIGFYNTWGEFCKKKGSRFRIYKYEDLRAEPMKHFSDMMEYAYGLSLPENTIEAALDYYSFGKQKEREFKYTGDESKHFHFRGKTDYTDSIAPETMSSMLMVIRRDLKHSFGYDYSTTDKT